MKISAAVCIKLQKAIFKSEYKPHTRVSSKRQLAETYQVSRSVIREAVARKIQGITKIAEGNLSCPNP